MDHELAAENSTVGVIPEVVGDPIYDAVVDNRLWLFTDDAWDANR